MPGWGEILAEIQSEDRLIQQQLAATPGFVPSASAPDIVRRRYLASLAAHTQRTTFLYASGWLQKSQIPGDLITVHPADMDGFLEVMKGANTQSGLDLILHSPGGSPEAAEQIVKYLRQKFEHIRVIVPMMAMSAATMIACAADEIVLARHSTLGPTDPQMMIRTNTGDIRMVAAHALRADFERAVQSAEGGRGAYAAWAPIIGQYPPGLLAQCEHALGLTNELVQDWLGEFMFRGQADAAAKAKRLADFFADERHFTHARPLMRDRLRQEGLIVSDMEADNVFQDLVMSTYHATTHTLGGTAAVKLIESNAGRGYFKLHTAR